MGTFSKEKIQHFIDLYHLSGMTKSVVWTFEKEGISTAFISQQKDVLGKIRYGNMLVDDRLQGIEMGIPDTKQLIKMLNVLDEEIQIDFQKDRGKVVSLVMKDENSGVQFILSDTDNISVPSVKEDQFPTEWDVEINITKEVAEKFGSGVKALGVVDFVVKTDKDVQLILGYEESYISNQVTINVGSNGNDDMDVLTFSAEALDEIMKVHDLEDEGSTLYVHRDGLASISFEKDQYEATYYIPAKDM